MYLFIDIKRITTSIYAALMVFAFTTLSNQHIQQRLAHNRPMSFKDLQVYSEAMKMYHNGEGFVPAMVHGLVPASRDPRIYGYASTER